MSESSANPQRRERQVAVVDESECIGCALCIKACPVDAIIGASTFMHTVLGLECIGCELCVAPCPTDCIAMVAAPATASAREQAVTARKRRRHRQARLTARTRRDADLMALQRDALKKAISEKADASPPDKLCQGSSG